MEKHRQASGAGQAMGELGGENAEDYRQVVVDLIQKGDLSSNGVEYDPYNRLEVSGKILAIFNQGKSVQNAKVGEEIETILPETCFYIEAGGQVSDTGWLRSPDGSWEIEIQDMRKPAAGVIVHVGKVTKGNPRVGNDAIASVDFDRHRDIMRNHSATHLLHAELRRVLGEHARQAGSLVAPDRLRFDFTHPEAVTPDQLSQIEAGVNQHILGDFQLKTAIKPLDQAISEGAMALFGGKYAEHVRTISIGNEQPFSYELCGGTHVGETGDIGICLIISEGSVAAGIRRIEAVTGRKAFEVVQSRFNTLSQVAKSLGTNPETLPEKANSLLGELDNLQKQVSALRQRLVSLEFDQKLQKTILVNDFTLISTRINDADADSLRLLVDRFRQKFPTRGIAVLASVRDGKPIIIAAVTNDITELGFSAIELVNMVAEPLGGKGGGRPTLAQAGGKDASKLEAALENVENWVKKQII
jgi:alanyl-tRNA synthetase